MILRVLVFYELIEMNRRKIVYTLVLVFTVALAKAQFEVDGQIRPRYEQRDGYKKLKSEGDKAQHYISQRSRIRFAYKADNLEVKLSFQDVHEWGTIEAKSIKEGTVGMHEGWAKLNFKNNTFIQVGRQEIQYDNARLLSKANWNQFGFTHDALRLGLKNDNWHLETVIAYNSSEGVEGMPYEMLNTIWLSKNAGKFSFSLLNLADLRQKNDSTDVDYLRNTVGPIVKFKSEKIGAEFRTFYQHGKQPTGMDVLAYYVNTELSYQFSNKFKTTGGFEVKSGNDANNTSSDTDNAFDIMHGTRHKFNGLIDYFSTPGTTKGSGLVDIYAKVGFNASEKVSLEAQWHYFNLQNNYVFNNQIMDSHLGNEIDLSANIKFSKTVELYLMYSTIFGTETLEAIKGGDKDLFNSYAVVMLTIKPTLFKTQKQ